MTDSSAEAKLPEETSRAGFAEEYPFASHFLDLDGQRYHYLDEGEGETLLFVHGNPTWSFAWRHLVRDLSRDHRVLAVDHVGCGFSDKPQNYDYTLATHIGNLRAVCRGARSPSNHVARPRLGRSDRNGDRRAIAGAVFAVRAVQHGGVSFAANPLANRHLPLADLRAVGDPRIQSVRRRSALAWPSSSTSG